MNKFGIKDTIIDEIEFAQQKINEQSLFKITQHQVQKMTNENECDIAQVHERGLKRSNLVKFNKIQWMNQYSDLGSEVEINRNIIASNRSSNQLKMKASLSQPYSN